MRPVTRSAASALLLLLLLFLTRGAHADDAAWTTSGKVEGGYELGAMYGRAMHGGRLRLGLGSQSETKALWATLSGRYGTTFVGLPTWDVRIGGDSELLRVGLFHAGAGVDIGIHGFTTRAKYDIANYDDPDVQYALSLGLSGRVGIDVVKLGESSRSAVTLDARLDGHLFLLGYYASIGAFVGLLVVGRRLRPLHEARAPFV